MFVDESILDRLDLSGDDGKHRDVDSVDLIESSPRPTLTETRKQLPYSLKGRKEELSVDTFLTMEDLLPLVLHLGVQKVIFKG